jgi:nucleotide-binding universal stress UspA family protein
MDRDEQQGKRQPVIRVGVGGSDASIAALIGAAGEARRRNSRLAVIEAWQVYPARALYAASPGDRGLPSRDAAADRLAARVRAVLGDAASRAVTTELVEGTAERVLAEASARADLLVLGSGSQSPVAQVDPQIVDRPTGPVIRACLSHARCPVLIIGPAMTAGLGIGGHHLAARAPAGARA